MKKITKLLSFVLGISLNMSPYVPIPCAYGENVTVWAFYRMNEAEKMIGQAKTVRTENLR